MFSILTRDPKTKLFRVYFRGNDEHMRKLINFEGQIGRYEGCINYNNLKGLKSHVFASKPVSEKDAKEICKDYSAAMKTSLDQELKLSKIAKSIEANLEFEAVVGFKNSLKEDSIVTINSLRDLGINVHVLTGDNFEHSLMVAHSLRLFGPDHLIEYSHLEFNSTDHGMGQIKRILDDITKSVLLLNRRTKNTLHQNLKKANTLEESKANFKTINIVISGTTVDFICANEYFKEHFKFILEFTNTIVGYNLSPTNKAEIVKLFRHLGRVTLACGDGYNDVNMLQASNISFQMISNLSGTQFGDIVVNNLLCISMAINLHARDWNNNIHLAVHNLIKYSIILALIQVFGQIYSDFSAPSMLNSFFITMSLVFGAVFSLIFVFTNAYVDKRVRGYLPGMYCENKYLTKRTSIKLLLYNFLPECSVVASIILFTSVEAFKAEYGNDGQTLSLYTVMIVIHCLAFLSLLFSMVVCSHRQKFTLSLLCILIILFCGGSIIFMLHFSLIDQVILIAGYEIITSVTAVAYLATASLAILFIHSAWWYAVSCPSFYPVLTLITNAVHHTNSSFIHRHLSDRGIKFFPNVFKKLEAFTTIYKRCFTGKVDISIVVTNMLLPTEHEINNETLRLSLHFESRLLAKKFRIYIMSKFTRIMMIAVATGSISILIYLSCLYILDTDQSAESLIIYILIVLLVPSFYYICFLTSWSRMESTYSTLYFFMLIICSILFAATSGVDYSLLGIVVLMFISVNFNINYPTFVLFSIISLAGFGLKYGLCI